MVRGSVFCGRYTFLDCLAAGDRSEIWRAFDTRSSREIAFRLLRVDPATGPEEWARLERAHAASLALAHTLILNVEAPVRSGDRVGQAMELTLRDAGSLQGAPLYQIVPLLFEVAKALAYAHAQGAFHRDLRLDHILVAKDGSVRLSGFGRYPEDAVAADAEREDIRAFGRIARGLLVDVPRGQRWLPLRLESLLSSLLDPAAATVPAMREVVEELDEALRDTAPLVEYIVPHSGAAPEHHNVGSIRTTIAQAASTPVTPPVAAPVIVPTPWVAANATPAPAVDPAPSPPPGSAAAPAANQTAALPVQAAPRAAPAGDVPAPQRPERAARALAEALASVRASQSVWRMRVVAVVAIVAIGAYVQWLIAPTLEGFRPDGLQRAESGRAEPAPGPDRPQALPASLTGALTAALAEGDARGEGDGEDAGAAAAASAAAEAAARITAAAELTRNIEEGERALSALDEARATLAFRNALAIDSSNSRASRGLARARRVGGIRGVMLDARSAEARGDYGRALQGYSQALANDPPNRDARAGVDRLREAIGLDDYGRAMSDGYVALGAGKLEKASESFALALRLRPTADAAVRASAETGAALAARENANRVREAALAARSENR